MRGQPPLIACLIALMCLVRFGLAAFGYADPSALMETLAAPPADNLQMPYTIRVWAVRDMVLAIVVAAARPTTIGTLLIACIAIDVTDIGSAWLSGHAGLFDAGQTFSLMTTAIAALVPAGTTVT
ncbi:MAG: hypothetical protein ACOYLS_15325, partial [Polymorphobacter sp.]